MKRQTALQIMLDATANAQDDKLIEARETVAHMLEQLDKHSNKTAAKSEARLANEKRAIALIIAMKQYGKPINSTWIAQNINGTLSSQRGTIIAKIGIEWGAIERILIDKRAYYQLVDNWQPNAYIKQLAETI